MLSYLNANTDLFFTTMKNAFAARWEQINAWIAASNERFTQLSRVGTFYPWIRCNLPSEQSNCTAVFASVGVQVIPGTEFGATSAFVRMELVQYAEVFQLMMSRLNSLNL